MKVKSGKRKIFLTLVTVFVLTGFLFSANFLYADENKDNRGYGDGYLIMGGGFGAEDINKPGVGEKYIENKIKGYTLSALGYATEVVVKVEGTVMNLAMWGIDKVLKYDNYTNEDGVIVGWTLVRDFSNMFFILILLIIAFATVLRIESYNYKRWLPKLIVMAILINFSLIICGEIINFSQIIIKFFIGTSKSCEGQIANTLGIKHFLEAIDSANPSSLDFLAVVAGYFLAILFLAISIVVLVVFLFVLVARLILLWLYTILSPLAYLLASFPAGQKYASRWWSDFSQQVITGPLLAFFLWLAFEIVNKTPAIADQHLQIEGLEMANTVNFTQFIMGIGMLLGGLKITSELGGVAGSIAGGGMRKINQGKSYAAGLSKRGAIKTAKWTGRQTLGLAGGADRMVSRGLTGGKVRGGFVGTGLQKAKYIATGGFIGKRNQAKIEADKARHEYFEKEAAAKKKLKNMGSTEEARRMRREGAQELVKLRLSLDGKEYRKEAQTGKFYRVNKQGVAINEKGESVSTKPENRVYAKRDSFVGKKNITAMGAAGAAMFMGRASALSTSWAAAKSAQDEKVSNDMKKIEAANMTPTMMMEQIRDGSVSGSKKMALALTMAIKDGFRGMNHKEVQEAKKTLGSNQLLTKKFNDEVDKKFAHLNYDMNTREGQETFKKRLGAGKIDDVMHDSAYKDPRVLNAIREQKGDLEFFDYIERVKKSSNAHKKAVIEGVGKSLSNTPLITPDGEVNPMRKAMVRLTGDISAAFKDVKSGDMSNLKPAMKELFANMSNKQLANIDPDSLDLSKALPKYSSDTGVQQQFETALREAVEDEVKNNLDGIKKAGGSNKLIRSYERLAPQRRIIT